MGLIITLLINSVAIFAASYILPGISLNNFGTAILVAVGLAIVNTLIKPILSLLTLPITILTLGLFTLVINGLMVWLVSLFVHTFVVQNFLWAMVFSIVISIISSILSWIFK
jgi:putative membrane protein